MLCSDIGLAKLVGSQLLSTQLDTAGVCTFLEDCQKPEVCRFPVLFSQRPGGLVWSFKDPGQGEVLTAVVHRASLQAHSRMRLLSCCWESHATRKLISTGEHP